MLQPRVLFLPVILFHHVIAIMINTRNIPYYMYEHLKKSTNQTVIRHKYCTAADMLLTAWSPDTFPQIFCAVCKNSRKLCILCLQR